MLRLEVFIFRCLCFSVTPFGYVYYRSSMRTETNGIYWSIIWCRFAPVSSFFLRICPAFETQRRHSDCLFKPKVDVNEMVSEVNSW